MTTGVSIIHGVRRPFESRVTDRRWMTTLASYLTGCGLKPVRCFEWSGGFLRSYWSSTHREYARSLVELWRQGHEANDGFRLQILAKSNGAVIAERALRHLAATRSDIRIGLLLRVATADPRSSVHIPCVDRVVSIASQGDALYTLGLRVARTVFRRAYPVSQGAAIRHERIVVVDAAHHHFNYPRTVELLTGGREDTFALYARLLAERTPV